MSKPKPPSSQIKKHKSIPWLERVFGSKLDPSDEVADALDIHFSKRESRDDSLDELTDNSCEKPHFDEDSYVKYVERHKQLHTGLHEKLRRDTSFKTRVSTLTEHVTENEDDGENMRLLLVRHAESEGNLDKSVWTTTPDYNIPLSENGIKQAQEAGNVIKEFYENMYNKMLKEWQIACDSIKYSVVPIDIPPKPDKPKVVLWTSPYKRTRQTTEEIYKIAKDYISEIREHIVLGEQQFGLFEGFDLPELQKFFPTEFLHFTKCVEFGGRFWARPPLGESRFDVATRVQQIFPKLLRDAEKKNVLNAIIVSHGVTIRAFCMMWLNRTPEWFEQDNNPENVAIRLIEKCQDKGYLFDGFKPKRSDHSTKEKVEIKQEKKE